MDSDKGFELFDVKPGLLRTYDDGNFVTKIFGFTEGSSVDLPGGYTHFGFVSRGKIEINYNDLSVTRVLNSGDFFSVTGSANLKSDGFGVISSAKDYVGFNIFGGPIEDKGKLKYIDGCSDSLLVAPVRKGDPCLNHLHFPKNITQTPHTHPSVRSGIVCRGEGVCLIPEEGKVIPLLKDKAFIIKTETIHSFDTKDSTMDVIAFHPDSDVGMTDEDHPMINRTIINGSSASEKSEYHTKEIV